jgi:putative hydrolase of the HAD superfamily
MNTPPETTDALLVDVLGTLLRLDSPAERLRRQLQRRGVELTPERAESAFRAEVAHYLAHHVQGRDRASLDELRRDCASVAAREAGVDPKLMLEALLEALHFVAYDDAAPALAALREARPGLRVVAVSNWDCSLPEVLERAGLRHLIDAVVTSAQAGAAKPATAIFELALRTARCAPDGAVHVGDTPENDVAGARAAGIRAVLLDRDGGADPRAQVPVIRSLHELASVI